MSAGILNGPRIRHSRSADHPLVGDWLAFDLDGCVRKSHGGRNPVAPDRSVSQTFHLLRSVGYLMAVGTGAGLEGAHLTEQHLVDFEFDILAVSYGALMIERNGHVSRSFLVPDEERAALAEITDDLEAIASELAKEHITDREGVCYSFHPPCEQSFQIACDRVKPLLAKAGGLLQFKPTSHDRGVVVAAASASKQLLVDRLRQPGNRIVVAAGDSSKADGVLLGAAEFAIVTFDEGSSPDPALVAIVEQKGCGYVATKPHGLGLVDGLYAARAAGVINF